MTFSVKYFFNKCDQIRSFLRIWSHLLEKSLMENFIFYVVYRSILFVTTFTLNKKTYSQRGTNVSGKLNVNTLMVLEDNSM